MKRELKNKIKNLFIVFFSIITFFSYAEGTKQVWPSGLDSQRQYLLYASLGSFPGMMYGCAVDYRLNIEIETLGEVIHLGFLKHNDRPDDLYYRIKDPSGTVVYGPIYMPEVADAPGVGRINTHAEALAGPASIVGGAGYNDAIYNPLKTGTYYIEFSSVNANGPPVAHRQFIRFWDIAVSKAGVIQTGRLWSKSWQLSADSYIRRSYATIYPYSNDGVVSKLELNGLAPYDFIIETNATGPKNTGNPVNDRKSVAGKSSFPDYKIFLNDPDSSLFPTGQFSSIDGKDAYMSGCNPWCINMKYKSSGLASLKLDFTNNGPSADDVTLTKNVVAGWNCFEWNGKNAQGILATHGLSITTESTILAGVTHYPLFDAEDHKDGFKISAIRPSVPVTTAYYDDTNLGGVDATAGVPLPAHTWSSGCNCSAGIGDLNTLNTWWFGVSIKDTVQFFDNQCSPVAVKDMRSVNSGNALNINVKANDFDGDGDAIRLFSIGTKTGVNNYTSYKGGTAVRDNNGTPADSTDDKLIYTSPANFTGIDSVAYLIYDSKNGRDTGMVYIMVWDDLDGDGVIGVLDIDADNDGIKNSQEDGGTGVNPALDANNDGIPNYLDKKMAGYVDTNGDGVDDRYDFDKDGKPDFLDLDSDNDGIPDIVEAGGVDINGDGFIDSTVDTDGDGLMNPYDTDNGGFNIAMLDTDRDGVLNYRDLDSDNDGIADIIEAGGTDSDNNGRVDNFTDTDNDGFHDPRDGDVGNDGVAENTAATLQPTGPNSGNGRPASYPKNDFDGDGRINQWDIDSDGDGIVDNVEAQIEGDYRAPLSLDSDGDGWDNRYDSDNGGVAIKLADTDGDGSPDYRDLDSDNDSIIDRIEGHDANSDGIAGVNPTGTDTDGDGLDNAYDNVVLSFANRFTNSRGSNTPLQNFDGDAIRDWRDFDDDNDDIPTISEPIHIQGTPAPDYLEVAPCPMQQTQKSVTTSGNATAVVSATNVTNQNNVLGVPNNTDAAIANSNGAEMVVDLTQTVANGQTIAVTWRKISGNGDAEIILSWSTAAAGPFNNAITYANANNTYITTNYVLTGAARYIRIQRNKREPGIDALSFNYITLTCVADWDMDGIEDAIDVDDDNDGIRDVIEGILDSDGDGTPNSQDLDSDNDGIPDAIEANGGFLPANMAATGQYSISFVKLRDANLDGYVSTTNELGTFTTFNPDVTDLDTDLDGIKDRLDLDSDNDGIRDAVEANNGVLPANMNVSGQYPAPYAIANDANRNGLIDPVDPSVVGGVALPIPDFDGDGLKDYRDLDSDNDGITDAVEGVVDADCNGKPDYIDRATATAMAGSWATPNTWVGGVIPTNNVNVVINHTVTNLVANSAGRVTVNVGGSLINNNTLTVKGNLSVAGTYSGTGTLVFAGTGACGAQTISGKITAKNITVTNPSGLSITSPASDTLKITGNLNLSGGNLITNGKEVVFKSTAAGTATVSGTSGNIVGNVNVERYLAKNCNTDGYVYLSSPVTTGATFTNWFNSGLWLTGFTGVYDVNGWANTYSYLESTKGVVDNGFLKPTNATNSIVRGKGYVVYAWRTSGMLPVTTTVKGPVNLDPFTWNAVGGLLTFTDDPAVDDNIHDGWNLLGNPYPGAIDWNSPNWTKVGCCDAVYSYSACADAYATYSAGVGVNGHDGKIAQGQSFYVKAHTPGASMSITRAALATSGGKIFRQEEPKNVLKLKVSDGDAYDELAVRVSNKTTANFDVIEDAPKFYYAEGKPSIYTVLKDKDGVDQNYTINSFGGNDVSQVPVMLRLANNGTHKLTFEGIESFADSI